MCYHRFIFIITLITFLLENTSKNQAKNDVSKIYDFMQLTNITKDVLDEYGELVIDRNALSILKHYFK